jgi:hypothetical protein
MHSKISQIRETRKACHNLAPRVPIYRAKDKINFRGQPEEDFKEEEIILMGRYGMGWE